MPAAKTAKPRRKATRTAGARSTPARKKAPRRVSAIARFERELPKELRDFSRQVRKDLTLLEKQIEGARKDVRRGMVRVLRDVSHQLGQFEANGERKWKRLTNQARRDAVKALKKLEKAIEPPKKKRKKASGRSKVAARASASAGAVT